MDRRHRAFLTRFCLGGALLLGLDPVSGQQPGPSLAPAPAPAATPWVQASPPPGKPLPPPRPPNAPPVVPVAAGKPPAAPNDLRRDMERRRQQELAPEAAGKEPDYTRAMQGMTPEERRIFERNLAVWRALSPAEKQALRGQAGERIRAEVEKAYQDSGLSLTPDQREVFGLRYRQERRHLEREMQERMNAERARRLPEIVDRIKREFPPAGSPSPGGTP